MRSEDRKRYVAVFLSLLAPGLGHVHDGRAVEGLTLAGGTAAVGMLGTVAVLASPFWSKLALVGAALGWTLLWVLAATSAARGALEASAPSTAPAGLRRRAAALLIALTVSSVATWAIAIREKVVEVFRVPSPSMEPTIAAGARVLVDKGAYRTGPVRRGDVVVFVDPNDRSRDYIKRVVALPGDVVEIRDDEVFVNGERLQNGDPASDVSGGRLLEETNAGRTYRVLLAPWSDGHAPGTFAPSRVPNGSCFVLGDNRRRSVDSRDVGPVPLADIVGRVARWW
jgi:signal peptidase I